MQSILVKFMEGPMTILCVAVYLSGFECCGCFY